MKKSDSFYLDNEVVSKIKEKAKADNRSKSDWLNLYLKVLFGNDNVTDLIPKEMIITKTEIAKPKAKSDNSEFEMLWSIYEKKGNKKTSLAKFNKLNDSQKSDLAGHVEKYVNSTPDKQFRKNLETYINQECWNDEISTTNSIIKTSSSKTANNLQNCEAFING